MTQETKAVQAPEYVLQHLERIEGYAGLKRVWEVLPSARLVGGCVRDLLCRKKVHDLDLASPFTPEEAQQRLEEAGAKVIPTGLEHGTVTAVINHVPYEITTLRRDVTTDGRHAVVAWTDDWEEDAQRRDFTINAMSLDRNGMLYDYFGGVEDLYVGQVRFVGDAARRIEEDALRSLRFFRFFARYGQGEADYEACKAIRRLSGLMSRLSIERVAMELLKILSGPQVLKVMQLMEETDILSVILPDYAPLGALARLLACEGPAEPLHRLAVLCPSVDIGARLKLSNESRKILRLLGRDMPKLAVDMDDAALRRVRFEQSLSVLLLRSWIMQGQLLGRPDEGWNMLRERLEDTVQPIFPLAGRDLLELGVAPGPDMGRWLKLVQQWWLAEGGLPDKDACSTWLRGQLSTSE